MNADRMRVIILDPGMVARRGHNYEMARGMISTLRGLELGYQLLGHKRADAGLQTELALRPTFTHNHYDVLSSDPQSIILDDLLAGSESFAKDMESVPDVQPGPQDLVVLPTASPRTLVGVASWLGRIGARPKVVALFHRVEPSREHMEPGSVAAHAHRAAANALTRALKRHPWLACATNDYLARMIAAATGIRVPTVPTPVWYGPAHAASPARAVEKSRPIVTVMGHMRRNHGLESVPKVIREIKRREETVRCRIHLGAVSEKTDLGEFDRLGEEGIAEVILGWQPDEFLDRLRRESTVQLMPYARSDYRQMISGVFCHAVAAGKPCVVPSDTWMADQIEAGRAAGCIYEGDSVEAVADAAQRVLRDSRSYAERAAACAPEWRRTQCGDLFVKKIVAWARNASGRSATGYRVRASS